REDGTGEDRQRPSSELLFRGASLTLKDKNVWTRYLLGDLPQADRERLEKESLADANAQEALVAAQNDLLDSYVRGDLSPNQRQQFEAEFLSRTAMSLDLEVARMLIDPAVREG